MQILNPVKQLRGWMYAHLRGEYQDNPYLLMVVGFMLVFVLEVLGMLTVHHGSGYVPIWSTVCAVLGLACSTYTVIMYIAAVCQYGDRPHALAYAGRAARIATQCAQFAALMCTVGLLYTLWEIQSNPQDDSHVSLEAAKYLCLYVITFVSLAFAQTLCDIAGLIADRNLCIDAINEL